MKTRIFNTSLLVVFIGLYLITSGISTIHVIDFFEMANPRWLAISLAIAFEIGAAASLGGIIIMDKTNKNLIWFLFILITAVQINGNMYYAWINVHDYDEWIKLFGLHEHEEIFQKRVLSTIHGAILPIVALGFIKVLTNYIKPDTITEESETLDDVENTSNVNDTVKPKPSVVEDYDTASPVQVDAVVQEDVIDEEISETVIDTSDSINETNTTEDLHYDEDLPNNTTDDKVVYNLVPPRKQSVDQQSLNELADSVKRGDTFKSTPIKGRHFAKDNKT